MGLPATRPQQVHTRTAVVPGRVVQQSHEAQPPREKRTAAAARAAFPDTRSLT